MPDASPSCPTGIPGWGRRRDGIFRIMSFRLPLFPLESRAPVRDFDVLGITLQFELCYTSALAVLDLAGIPLLAADRGDAEKVKTLLTLGAKASLKDKDGVLRGAIGVSGLTSAEDQQVTDFIAPLVPLGLAAGRIGNFINGELWGRAADASLPWAMVFPQSESALARHPSQLYEAFLEGLLLFWWLHFLCTSLSTKSKNQRWAMSR